MMQRLDFLELIAQKPQRFFLRTIQRLLSGTDVFTSLANSGGVFSKINPRHGKGNTGI